MGYASTRSHPASSTPGLGAAFVQSDRLASQVLSRTPLGRFGDAAELTDATAFLAGDGSGYMTGHVIAIDGGYGLG